MLGAKPHLSWHSTHQILEESCDSREILCDVILGSTLGDETGKRRRSQQRDQWSPLWNTEDSLKLYAHTENYPAECGEAGSLLARSQFYWLGIISITQMTWNL